MGAVIKWCRGRSNTSTIPANVIGSTSTIGQGEQRTQLPRSWILGLLVLVLPSIALAIAPDNFEYDGKSDNAKVLPLDGTLQERNFDKLADTDWVSVTVAAGSTATVRPVGGTHASDRWKVAVYKMVGSTTTFVETYGFGQQNPAIELLAPSTASQEYRLRFNPHSSNPTFYGNYSNYWVSGTQTGSGPPPPPFEPNDTWDQAGLIAGPQDHNFHVANDQDWMYYHLVPAAGSTITIEPLQAQASARWEARLYLREQGASGAPTTLVHSAQLSSQPVVWSGINSQVSSSRDYYIQVLPLDSSFYGTPSNYRVTVLGAPFAPPYEPNDTWQQATPISGTQDHYFHVPEDIDWMVYDVPAGQTGTVTVSPVTASGSVQWIAQLYRQQAGGSGPEASPLQTANMSWQAISWSGLDATAGAGARFYIRVAPAIAFSGATSNYRVAMANAPLANNGPFEPNNDWEHLTPITAAGPTQTHLLDVAGDVDWIGYWQVGGRTSTITVTPQTPTATAQWKLDIYRQEANALPILQTGKSTIMGPGPVTISGLDTPTSVSAGQGYYVVVSAINGLSGTASTYTVSTTDAPVGGSAGPLGYAPASVCGSTATGPAGAVPTTPGLWWNPQRDSTGWSFSHIGASTTPTAPNLFFATWYTFDALQRPTWLGTLPNALQQSAGDTLWSSPLLRYSWDYVNNVRRSGVQVGEVSIRFLADDPTKVALRWRWDEASTTQSFDECVVDFFRSTVGSSSQNKAANAGLSGAWHEPALDGYGYQVTIVPYGTSYVEIGAVTAFDSQGAPVWVQGSRVQPGAPPSLNKSESIALSYYRSPFPNGVPTSTCQGAGCQIAASAGSLSRSFNSEYDGLAQFNLGYTPAAGAPNQVINWKRPGNLVGNVAIAKIAGVNQVVVDRVRCNLSAAPCSVHVDWASADGSSTAARLYRHQLDAPSAALVRIPVDARTGEYNDGITVAGRYRYELKQTDSPSAANLALSAELTVTGAVSTPIGSEPPEPYTPPSVASMADSDRVGASTGAFSTGAMGEVSYSFPIYSAPSAGGTGPQMALAYSSSLPFGVGGAGWSISGMSSISRCRKTLESGDASQNGEVLPPVTLTRADAYCMDGQRLLPVSSLGGVCAGAAAEYRTEVESFRRVCAYDDVGAVGNNGHAHFVVYGKDGTISTFGRDLAGPGQAAPSVHSSRLIANVGTFPRPVVTWALARVQDTAGNFFDYRYLKSDVTGEQYLTEVRYNGNLRVPQDADHTLMFVYADLPSNEVEIGRVGPATTSQRKYLAAISSLGAAGTSLRNYRLTYDYPASGARRQLQSIQECDSEAGNAICYRPTLFEWSGQFQRFSAGSVGSGGENGFDGLATQKLGDIDGDGLQDVVWVKRKDVGDPKSKPEEFWITRTLRVNGNPQPAGEGSGRFSTGIKFDADSNNLDLSWHLFDFNADGRDDLLRLHASPTSGYSWVVHLAVANGSGFSSTAISTGISAYDNKDALQFSDFTGDGLPDALVSDGNPLLFPYGLRIHPMQRALSGNLTVSFGNSWPVELNHSGYFVPNSGQNLGDPGDQYEPFYALNGNLGGVRKLDPVDANGDGASDLTVRVYLRDDRLAACSPRSAGTVNHMLRDGDLANGNATDKGSGQGLPAYCFIPYPGVFKADGLVNSAGATVFRFSANGQRLGMGCYINELGTVSGEITAVQYGDVNGDGFSDAVYTRGGGDSRSRSCSDRAELASHLVALNSPSGFGPGQYIGGLEASNNTAESNQSLQLMDVNNDSQADIVYTRDYGDSATNRYRTRLWNGQSFDPASEFPGTGPGTYPVRGNADWTSLFTDLDGDARLEILRLNVVCQSAPCTTWQILHPLAADRGTPNQRLVGITTGLGSVTELTFAPLSDRTVYQRATGSLAIASWGRGSPVIDLTGAYYVLKEARSSAPALAQPGAMASVRYFYREGRVQGGGRGMLGFKETHTYTETLVGSNERIRSIISYEQKFPFTGQNSGSQSDLVNVDADGLTIPGTQRLLSLAVTSYLPVSLSSPPVPVQVLVASSSQQAYEPGTGTLLSYTRSTNQSYDSYGNLLLGQTAVLDGNSQILRNTSVSNVYASDDSSNWRLGRLTRSAVNYGDGTTRTSEFSYDSATGQLTDEIIEPQGGLDLYLRKAYELDLYGQRLRQATCSRDIGDGSRAACLNTANFAHHRMLAQNQTVQRMERMTWAQGRYLNKKYVLAFNGGVSPNDWSEQYVEQTLSFDNFGNPTQTQNVNGSAAYAQYGALGRQHAQWTNTGGASEARYAWCTAVSCPAGMAYRLESLTRGAASSWAYYDVLGRERLRLGQGYSDPTDPEAAALGFNTDQYVGVQTEYDRLGRAIQTSEPFFAQGPASAAVGNPLQAVYWTRTLYDSYGRPYHIDLPEAGAYTETIFDGLQTTTVTIPCAGCAQQSRKEMRNLFGQVVETTDTEGRKVCNLYSVRDELIQVDQAPLGNCSAPQLNLRSSISIDPFGRRTAMTDPDKGTWSYTFNALGETVQQRDAKNQLVIFSYDALGRVWRREDRRSNGTTEAIATWTFDTAANGLGGLASESISAGSYSKSYSYDQFGRGAGTSTSIDGAVYSEQATYDRYGRSKEQIDASGLGIRSEYTQRGYLKRIREASGLAANSILNEVHAINARGEVTEERRGGLVSLTVLRAYYADSGRLQTVISGGGALQNLSYKWDFLGNLTERYDRSGSADVKENFDYDPLNRLTTVRLTRLAGGSVVNNQTTLSIGYDRLGNINSKSGVGSYSYASTSCGGAASGPHAVSNAGGVGYCYDANGNQVSASDGRNISYSVFDKPTSMIRGGDGVQFDYGTSRNMVKRVDGGEVTRFIGSTEHLVNQGAYRRQAAGAIVKLQGATRTLSYVFTDHLGSTDLIVDSTGQVQQRQSFDAHGGRRAPLNWDAWPPSSQINFDTSLTRKSFTGHEGVDRLGLIHFGGRLYDPRLGRFVQADPMVEDAATTDGLNRYTYVLNNPLSLTDPSGYLSWGEVRPYAAIVIGALLNPAFLAGSTFWGAVGVTNELAAVALTGAISGAVQGGTNGAVFGAFSAVANYGVGSVAEDFGGELAEKLGAEAGAVGAHAAGLALHAIKGGILEIAQGGSGGAGARGAFLNELLMPAADGIDNEVVRQLAVAVVGGTVSQATGGKFANGALSAAFQYNFNRKLHEGVDNQKYHQGLPILNDQVPGTTLMLQYSEDGSATGYAWASQRQAADIYLAQQTGAKSVSAYKYGSRGKPYGTVSVRAGALLFFQVEVTASPTTNSLFLGIGAGPGSRFSRHAGATAGPSNGWTLKGNLSGLFRYGRGSLTLSEAGMAGKAGASPAGSFQSNVAVGYTFSWKAEQF